MAVRASLTIYRGQAITFTATADRSTNVAGWTVAFTVRPQFGKPVTLQATSGNGNGITATDPGNGVFSITLTKDQTLQSPGSYVWDLGRIDPGFEDTLAYGTCVIAESYYF